MGVVALPGCGDPCLDDGLGKGDCSNQTGADEASTTDASATGTAEGTADGNSESASGTAESSDTATDTTTDTATTDATATDTNSTDSTSETGVDACADMMMSEGETDLDCGGPCVIDPVDPLNPEGKCGPGQGCLMDGDCVSNFCDPRMLVCVDLCTNMMEDASETDIDCGGACVVDPLDPANPEGKCDDGEGCLVDSDCVSNACDPNDLVCVGVCSNGVFDPDVETDVDCGDDCVIVNPNDMNDVDGQCNQGEACNDPVDCVAGDCIDNQCDVCALQDDYTTCQTCLVTNCCPEVQDCLANIDKCVCWFNCIGTMGASVQGCMDSCGNGNIGPINACLNNSCKGANECN